MTNNTRNRHILYVSFKNTEKELKLFNYVNGMENQEKSEFVKKSIVHYMEYLNSQNNK